MPATKTLPQCAHDAIESAIDDAADDEPVVLWWDDGGYLRDIVEHASTQLRCEFRAAERTPLELRADAPRDRTVWYVPRPSSDDVDWFKDVEHTGGVIEQHIGKLAARCFENDRLQAATIRTAYEDAEDRETVARTLYAALDGEGGLPSLQGLQTKIVLDGHDDPVQFVLEHGTRNLPEGDDLLKIRDLLVDDGVTAVEGAADARTIVERTRRWAVAEWLVDEGLDTSLLPQEYQSEPSTGFGIARPELRSVLSKTERNGELANVYLNPNQRFWHDVLRSCENPWELADCPVDASLEHRLWDEWFLPMDPNNLICMAWKWKHADVSRMTGGDLSAALERIRARTYVMPFEQDMVFTLEDAENEETHIPDSELRPIPTPWGHFGMFGFDPADKEFIDDAIGDLLDESV